MCLRAKQLLVFITGPGKFRCPRESSVPCHVQFVVHKTSGSLGANPWGSWQREIKDKGPFPLDSFSKGARRDGPIKSSGYQLPYMPKEIPGSYLHRSIPSQVTMVISRTGAPISAEKVLGSICRVFSIILVTTFIS